MAKKTNKRAARGPQMRNNPYKAKKERQISRCPVCGAPLKMVPVSEMGFRFQLEGNRAFEFYWVCSRFPECDTYTPADRNTKKPWGIPSGPSLRYKHMAIHHWENHMVKNGLYTREAFRSLCSFLVGTRRACETHVRDMTEYQCDTILNYMKTLYNSNERIRESVDLAVNSTPWREVRGLNTDRNHGVIYNEAGEIEKIKEEDPELEGQRASAMKNEIGHFYN